MIFFGRDNYRAWISPMRDAVLTAVTMHRARLTFLNVRDTTTVPTSAALYSFSLEHREWIGERSRALGLVTPRVKG